MHFLIGFLILTVILAVPALRNVALVLVGLCVLAVLIVLGNNRRTIEPPLAPDLPQTDARLDASLLITTAGPGPQ
jgi:hypothetical protein